VACQCAVHPPVAHWVDLNLLTLYLLHCGSLLFAEGAMGGPMTCQCRKPASELLLLLCQLLMQRCRFASPNRWSYDPLGDTFVWLAGSPADSAGATSQSNYSSPGVFTPTALPYPRSGAAGVTDSSGMLWLIGGIARVSHLILMNDVWKFSPVIAQWCWVAGSSAGLTTEAAVYGNFRVPSTSNVFPARSYRSTVLDPHAQRFYIFAGSSSSAFLSDM
jgi:hypothetical protein